jgi:Primase zinc finger
MQQNVTAASLTAAFHKRLPCERCAPQAQTNTAPVRRADLLRAAVKCFVFGGAAEKLSQLRPGAVVALLGVRWDAAGGDSLKIVDADAVREVGVSADMAGCRGVTRGGEPCKMIVNRHVHGAYCDAHLAQVRSRHVWPEGARRAR